MRNITILFIALVLLSGCNGNMLRRVNIRTEEVPIPMYHPPLPDSIVWQDFEWQVLTPGRMQFIINQINMGKLAPQALYALPVEDYQVLIGNMAEIKQFMKQQKSLIQYYRKNVKKMLVPTKKNKSINEKTNH